MQYGDLFEVGPANAKDSLLSLGAKGLKDGYRRRIVHFASNAMSKSSNAMRRRGVSKE